MRYIATYITHGAKHNRNVMLVMLQKRCLIQFACCSAQWGASSDRSIWILVLERLYNRGSRCL